MKVLVNKNNPAIRITAPEVEVYDKYYYITNARLGILQEYWTLVEEESKMEDVLPSNLDEAAQCYYEDRMAEKMSEKVETDDIPRAFKAGAEFIIEQIEDFISKRTYNAHDMSYYQGKDEAYCEILNLLREINNGKQ